MSKKCSGKNCSGKNCSNNNYSKKEDFGAHQLEESLDDSSRIYILEVRLRGVNEKLEKVNKQLEDINKRLNKKLDKS